MLKSETHWMNWNGLTLEIKLEETDLRLLLDDVLEAARPTIAKAGIVLRVDLPAEFPHVLVDGQLI